MFVLIGALMLGALFAAPVQAFTVQGGISAQRAYVSEVIEACSLPYTYTDSELRALGPVKVVIVKMDNVSAYSKMGIIYVNSCFSPGEVLGELVAHEWSHQIWYSLGPKWWQKWQEVCGACAGSGASSWRADPAENFAECAKVALWGSQYCLRDYACTDLAVIDAATVRDWLALARYVNKCPFADLDPTAMPTTHEQDEIAAAAGYVYVEGIMQGFTDTTFRADAPLTKQQLAAVCDRAGLSCPGAWRYDSGVATRGEVHDAIPGLTWTTDHWSESINRGQVARLIWRTR
jgi:hypothetical protein